MPPARSGRTPTLSLSSAQLALSTATPVTAWAGASSAAASLTSGPSAPIGAFLSLDTMKIT
jgi:hypothetical protein